MKNILITLALLFCIQIAYSQTIIQGKVIKVADGDTFTLLTDNNEQVKVRLAEIDAPEKGQDYGTKATNFVKELIAGKKVKVDVTGTDRYKRTLGVVWVGNTNLNEELVKQGLAWRWKFSKSKHYLQLQEQAQTKKINIWSMKNPIDPYDFRKQKKNKSNPKK